MRNAKFVWIAAVVLTLSFAVGSAALAAEYDFGGRTVRFILDKGATRAWAFDTTENIWSTPVVEGHMEAIEAAFNVNLEFSDSGVNMDVLAASILAGDPVADVIMGTDNHMVELINAGMLYPLTDVLASGDFGRYPTYFEDNWDWYSLKGEIYALPKKELPVSSDVVFINKNILDIEGLPDPQELWTNGEWTWDAFLSIVEQAHKDTTGDGVIDQLGVTVNEDPWRWIMSNGGNLFYDVVDDYFTATIDTPEVVEAVEFARELYWNGYTGGHRNDFIEGIAALRVGGAWEAGIYAIDIEEMPFQWAIVPLPMGPSAQRHHAAFNRIMGFFFPVTTEDINAMVELTNAVFFLTDKYEPESAWVDDRVHGYIRAGSPDRTSYAAYAYAVDNMERILHTRAFDLRPIVTADGDPASLLAAYQPEVQSILNARLDQ